MKQLKAGAADLRVSERASGAGLQLGITHQGTQHPGGQSSSAQSKKQFGSEVLEVFFFFFNVQLDDEKGVFLLFRRQQIEFGSFRPRLSKHDGKRLHD